jgi:hypothetical protein
MIGSGTSGAGAPGAAGTRGAKRTISLALGVAVLASAACTSEKTKECLRQVEVASRASKEIDAKSIASVEQALAAVTAARSACDAAGRDGEVAQLDKGKKELAEHLERLRKRAADPARRPLGGAEIAVLVDKGDPHCPKGQAYKHSASGKEIRCTGPQIVDMNYAEARDYFERRGYKLTDVEPNALSAEHGSELVVLTYARPKDVEPPRCVTLYAPPEQSWQEATARVTGARPDRLEAGGTVSAKRGKLTLRVDADASSGTVRLGDCGS